MSFWKEKKQMKFTARQLQIPAYLSHEFVLLYFLLKKDNEIFSNVGSKFRGEYFSVLRIEWKESKDGVHR